MEKSWKIYDLCRLCFILFSCRVFKVFLSDRLSVFQFKVCAVVQGCAVLGVFWIERAPVGAYSTVKKKSD